MIFSSSVLGSWSRPLKGGAGAEFLFGRSCLAGARAGERNTLSRSQKDRLHNTEYMAGARVSAGGGAKIMDKQIHCHRGWRGLSDQPW